MTSTPPTHHTPARWRAKAAVLAATAITAAGARRYPGVVPAGLAQDAG